MADVSRTDEVTRFAETVLETFGGADILINNAGTGSEETIMEADDEKWQYYLDLHLMAAVRLSRAFVPAMRERGGGVILQQRVDLRDATARLRTHLQRLEGGAGDVFQMPR